MSTTAFGRERKMSFPADVFGAADLRPSDRLEWRFEDGEIRGCKLPTPKWTKAQGLRATEQSPLCFTAS
jgi:hypothetical protein